MMQDIKEVWISEEELQQKVKELGAKISEDYKDKNLLMVSVLKGSVVFMADLMRAITVPAAIDFMSVSSYGAGTKSTGVVRIIKDLDTNVADYDLLLVEDILDSGNTLAYLRELLSDRHPRSIKIATLLDKPSRRTADIHADYMGFEIADQFVVGYGLDYNEKYRNLSFIGILKPCVYGGE
ncbi:MAG: hypoxanthine phosphoribosyltransferase [Oscillospiraceae bacterium]|nr:hypoxanthine phosphoribosyltransferase [Oscillospiraceae bacterium]MBQ8918421.1 hypoxanthine phosphoribosyltransferase [Oscillospiraceae bacterium]MBQ9109042.1 hypoxanthine phosphoribosyltransferase [Oscillospiraceae bacterium]